MPTIPVITIGGTDYDVKDALARTETKKIIDGKSPEMYSIEFAVTFAGTWNTAGTGYLIPCNPGDTVVIGNSVQSSYYTVLKSADNLYSGKNVDFATGYSSIKTYGQPTTFVVPSDGRYVWLWGSSSGVDYTPTKLSVNNYDYLKSNRDHILEINKNIDTLSDRVDAVDGDVASSMTTKYAIDRYGKWVRHAYDASFFIPVEPGSRVIVKRVGSGYYSCLKNIDNVTDGGNPNYATGYTGFVYWVGETSFTVPDDTTYIWVYRYDGSVYYIPTTFTVNGYPVLENIKNIIGEQNEVISRIDLSQTTSRDVADGLLNDLTPYNGADVSFHEENVLEKKNKMPRRVVAINHDDLQRSDYVNTRKIYNKYGFNANFNLIMEPYPNAATIEEKRVNVRRLIADGNEIGFHSPIGGSFWWMNKMFDVRPDGSFTFAPTLSDIKTVVSGSSNVFGYQVDLSKPISSYGFANPPGAYASVPVGNLTVENYREIIGRYTYLFSTNTSTGLDIHGSTKTWTPIQWLEHWYNCLIDDSLGYTDIGSITSVYSNYETNNIGVYPDAEHMLNGKIVFYDDVNNPNYNNSEYQRVGRFTKGLFKGAATACNHEVRGRIIEIAKAYMKHYFGIDNIALYGRHGVGYVATYWNAGRVPYDDKNKNIIAGEFGKTYNSIKSEFETGLSVLLEHGIRMTNHFTPLNPVYHGQYGLYEGQSMNRSPFFACADLIFYLVVAGSDSDDAAGSYVSTESMLKIFSEQKDPLKFVYEKAGQYVESSDGLARCFVTKNVKKAIDLVRGCFETGKIPFLSVDTIANNASNIYATELLCQYCYDEGIDIVTPETARKFAISHDRTYRNNYFPNPLFYSSILKRFGGSSSSNDAYRPDGWKKYSGSIINAVDIENGHSVYKVSTDGSVGSHYNLVEIWGLPSGHYRFTCKAKQTGNNGRINVALLKNESYANDGTTYDRTPGSNYSDIEIPFIIPEPVINIPNSNAESQYNVGYENNVISVQIRVGFDLDSVSDAETISLYEPKIISIQAE